METSLQLLGQIYGPLNFLYVVEISTAFIILCSVVSSIMPLDRRINGSLAFLSIFNSVQSSGPEVINLFF